MNRVQLLEDLACDRWKAVASGLRSSGVAQGVAGAESGRPPDRSS